MVPAVSAPDVEALPVDASESLAEAWSSAFVLQADTSASVATNAHVWVKGL